MHHLKCYHMWKMTIPSLSKSDIRNLWRAFPNSYKLAPKLKAVKKERIYWDNELQDKCVALFKDTFSHHLS